MKNQVYLFSFMLVVLMFCTPSQGNATHYMGVDITYECLSSCTYRVYHNTYYDCDGAATTPLPGPPFPPNINFIPTTCSQPSRIGTWQLVHYIEITPICPGVQTKCTNSSAPINGVLEAQFYQDFNFCNVNCTSYTLTWSTCCRNGVITSGAANNGIGTSTTTIDLGQPACNNSPQFTSYPVHFICANTASSFTQGAYDIDGDSLAFSLGACTTNNSGTQVTYVAGYGPLTPLGPSWNITLDPQTGQLDFVPTPGNMVTGVLCVYVNEYRNGILIGQISRDMQVAVLSCGNVGSHPVVDSINQIVNAVQSGPYKIATCPGSQVRVTFHVSDVDSADTIFVSSNISSVFPGATVTTTGINPIQATVTFPTTLTGTYGFIMNFSNNQCPLPNYTSRTYTVVVGGACITGQVIDAPCQVSSGAIDISVNGGQPPYSYSWSNGDTTQDISGLLPGVYTVTVTDMQGTMFSKTFWVNGTSLNTSTSLIHPDCNGAPGAILTNVSGGVGPYSYLWNTGSVLPHLTGLLPGGYSLTVTDSLGCTRHLAVVLDQPDSCYNVVEGYIYDDLNQNCIQDAGEAGIANAYVDITPGGAVLSGPNGYYQFRVGPGTHSIAITPTPYRPAFCPITGVHTVNFPGLKQTVSKDFALDVSNVWDLRVTMVPDPANRGHQRGTLLTVRNDGTVTMSGALSFSHDPSFDYLNGSPSPAMYDPLTYTATWTFVNLLPGQVFQTIATTDVDASAVLGSVWTESAQVLPIVGDSTPVNNVAVFADTIRASNDPNDKQVFPVGIRSPGYILASENDMYYTIRFQNNGNDTAFYVVIRDTLDNDLEVSSYWPGSESHPYSLFVEDDSILVFTFTHIMLPDSGTNPQGSQGHVSFYLRHNGTLSPGTVIENSASIYFDFNAPVITNTVINTIYSQPIVSMGNDTTVCEGQSLEGNIIAAGMPPYHFFWSTGDNDPGNFIGMSQTVVTTSGTYWVKVTDAFGFTTTDTIQVMANPLPDAAFTINQNKLAVSFAADSTINTTWDWDFGDSNTVSGAATASHTYASKGVYTVTLITTNGCGSDTTIQVIDFTVGLDKNEVDNLIVIQPNPFSSSTFVSFDNPAQNEISIYLYDLQGRQVRKYSTTGERVEILRGELAKGLYLLEVRGSGVYYGRAVVE